MTNTTTIGNVNRALAAVEQNSLVPTPPGTLDLGSSTSPYGNVYANNFQGNFTPIGLSANSLVQTDSKGNFETVNSAFGPSFTTVSATNSGTGPAATFTNTGVGNAVNASTTGAGENNWTIQATSKSGGTGGALKGDCSTGSGVALQALGNAVQPAVNTADGGGGGYYTNTSTGVGYQAPRVTSGTGFYTTVSSGGKGLDAEATDNGSIAIYGSSAGQALSLSGSQGAGLFNITNIQATNTAFNQNILNVTNAASSTGASTGVNVLMNDTSNGPIGVYVSLSQNGNDGNAVIINNADTNGPVGAGISCTTANSVNPGVQLANSGAGTTLSVTNTGGGQAITATTGGIQVPVASGLTYSGTVTGTAAATSGTLNSKVGTFSFTGQTYNAATSVSLTINNNVAGSAGLVAVQIRQSTASALYPLYVYGKAWSSGSNITVNIANDNAATNITADVVVDFISFN